MYAVRNITILGKDDLKVYTPVNYHKDCLSGYVPCEPILNNGDMNLFTGMMRNEWNRKLAPTGTNTNQQ